MHKTVAIGGLGATGLPLARALDAGVEGLRLVAVAARDPDRARATVAGFRSVPRVVALEALAEADIVVEAAPAAVFSRIAEPAIAAGRVLVPASVGALLPRMDLVARARETGARIVVPTGALLGLDAVRAAAEGRVSRVAIETRKPPAGLAGAPYLVERGTEVTIWADPTLERNTHTIRVEADAARLCMRIENVPSPDNPRTGRLTPLSVLACLRGLVSPLKVGS